MGRHLLEQGDNIVVPGFHLPGTGSLAITFDDTRNQRFNTRLPGLERDSLREYRQYRGQSPHRL
jgi:hypothetical protein